MRDGGGPGWTEEGGQVAVLPDVVPDVVAVADRRDHQVAPGQQRVLLHSLSHHPGDDRQTPSLLAPAGLAPS